MYLKPSRRKKARIRTTVLIIAGVAAAAVFVVLFFTGMLPFLSFGTSNIRTLDKILPDNVTANDNGFLFTEGNAVVLLDKDGKESWSLNLELPDPSTVSSPTLICNYSGKSLQVMQYNKEQLFNTTVGSDILDAAAGQEYVAVLLNAPAENGTAGQSIYLFDKGGQQTGQLLFTRQVIDFGFFSDPNMTDLFWTLSLDTSGVAPVSYITMYNKATGEMTYSITINSRIIEHVYVSSNLIFASGTNTLTAYTYFGETQSEQMIYGWTPGAVSLQESAIRIAYVPRGQSAYIEAAQIYSADSAAGASSFADARISLPRNVLAVAVTPARLYAYSADTVSIYTLSGQLEKTQDLGTEITKVKQVSNEYAILWDMQKTYIMHLQ